ncbi:MAG: DUF4149 domain-containing protein [Isosphaeraceae bacterium]|nr:DUF4149 domain-containing protein [Isosphaeraceae bacterium]
MSPNEACRSHARDLAAALLRRAAEVGLALWFGGFTFYAGIVVPVLHEEYGAMEAGAISRRVSDPLNLLGIAALGLAVVRILADRVSRRGRLGFLRASAVAIGFLSQLILMILNEQLDLHLDTRGISGFYRLHERYLILSTVEWAAVLTIFLIGEPRRSDREAGSLAPRSTNGDSAARSPVDAKDDPCGY